MPSPNPALLHQVAQLVLRLARTFKPANSPQTSQNIILHALQSQPLTVPALARALATSRQNVQLIVDRLLERGLIVPQTNPAHKRSPLYRAAAGALELLLAAEHAQIDQVQGLPIAEEELETVRRVLERMEAHLCSKSSVRAEPAYELAQSEPAPQRRRPARSARMPLKPKLPEIDPAVGVIDPGELETGELPVNLL